MATLVSHICGVGDVCFILVKHEHVIVITCAVPMLQSKAYACMRCTPTLYLTKINSKLCIGVGDVVTPDTDPFNISSCICCVSVQG